MATIIIAKNNTINDILVGDLGVRIPGSSQVNLTEVFTKIEISFSSDLDTLISSGDIIINNGSDDLSISNALKHTNFETEYEDTETTLPHTHVESDITDLDHDAHSIRGVEISAFSPVNKQALVYDNTSNSIVYDTPVIGVEIGISPTDADPGTIWVKEDSSMPYILDSTSGEWLSVSRTIYTFNAQYNIDGSYIPISFGGAVSYYIPRPSTITSLYCKAIEGDDTKTFYIRDDITNLYTFSFNSSYIYIANNLRINLEEGTDLRVFVSDIGIPVRSPIVQLEVAWRYTET